MKGPGGRTKVVLRHLPPSFSESSLLEQVDSRFTGRYNWVTFRPGKSSLKNSCYSRAYIDFKRPEDVIEFADFFDGHVFVSEKGAQFKTLVEYAPSQRVPKQWSKKDGREGTILKDPEYLEFLEFLSKPVENLPSAEIQLERKEAERAGAGKQAPVVTPLMDYVRQKRAEKSGLRRPISNGRSTRRFAGPLSGSLGSSLPKRGAEKRRVSAATYVRRDAPKDGNGKDKSTYIMSKRDSRISEKTVSLASATSTDAQDEESGGSVTINSEKKILLLKGKEKEIPYVSGVSSEKQNVASHAKNSPVSTAVRQNQRREAGGRIIRSILLNREKSQNLSSVVESEQNPTANPEKDKRPRPPRVHLLQKDANETVDERVSTDLYTGHTEKQDRQMRNRDRPDRVVWTPLRRSDGSHASEETLSSSAPALGSAEGSYKHVGRRGSAHIKDSDGYSVAEGKSSRRGSSGYGTHEKQVWVQKSSTGS